MLTIALFALALAALVVVSTIGARRLEAAYPAGGRIIAVGGEEVHLIDEGPRTPHAIVLIHGASGNHRDLSVPLGERLAQRHRVIVLDRPGHGASTRRAGRALASPDAQARLIAAALREVGVERSVIVGHSFGAAVALALALEAPAEVAGLVLMTPVSHPWGAGGISWHNRVAATPVIGPAFAATFAYPVGSLVIGGVLPVVFGPDAVPAGYAERAAPSLVLRPDAFRANAEDVVALQANVTRLQAHYATIAASVLVIEGAHDPIVRNEIHAAGIVQALAGAERISLPTGHMPHWTATEEVLAAIERFVGRTLPGDRTVVTAAPPAR